LAGDGFAAAEALDGDSARVDAGVEKIGGDGFGVAFGELPLGLVAKHLVGEAGDSNNRARIRIGKIFNELGHGSQIGLTFLFDRGSQRLKIFIRWDDHR